MQHVLQLYQEEDCLLDALADYVAAGLRVEEGVLVFGTTPRWELLLDRLQKSGVEARAHAARGQLKFYGVHVLLSNCACSTGLDRYRLGRVLASALEVARMRYERVRVFSELTDARWRDGDRAGVVAIERAWKPLLSVHDFSLLCACPIDSLEGDTYDGTLQALCSTHTHVSPTRDEVGFEGAVTGAVAEVLDSQLVRMLEALSAAHRPNAHMPPGQAMLFWLTDHMPRTAEKVMRRARARWSEH
ncbi:MAG TPA: MEDS domain-containing protein [Burkholderiales bacterium]|nr:MEDS domain-containing protein [Burkholderiales bacterium]